jgi:Na+/H+ antiporter NhaD/arsenite permease-like protein
VHLGEELAVWSVLPFAGLLLSIAILPLLTPHFWERNRNKGIVAALFSAPVALYLLAGFGERGLHELVEKGEEYASFILLLASLYVITGGIYVRGSLSGTPLLNTAVIAIGAALASVIGTTGASVLLIRPLLRANAPRQRTTHIVVFFIFVVSNCGGLLTPLGDPPLFLGFLKGVPFEWTLALWKEWLLVNGSLLVVFNVWDQIVFAREERERPGSQLEEVQEHEPLGIEGLHNFGFLAGIDCVIYGAGRGLGSGGAPWPFGVQEALMFALAAASYASTSVMIRRRNEFAFGPITEVALLFAGIFVTMAPALLLLNAHAASFGLHSPAQFFWATGLLSSFLDNAPTYLTFAATASGLAGIGLEGRYLAELLATGAESSALLAAISCGAVFMGANTYIGNGPNFMVKAIAEGRGVRMPSFFGYMLYSGGVLIPLFALTSLLFF